MYGLLVELEIDETMADGAIEFLHQVAVPMIKEGGLRERHMDAVA